MRGKEKETYGYILRVRASEFSKPANTKKKVLEAISGVLLCECSALYTIFVAWLETNDCNSSAQILTNNRQTILCT